MATADEKLCLQWNDFKENVCSTFGDLRQDNEFTDVTLACEDGQQVEAHKVILVASSPFFLNILKRNKHPHPLIYMRGVRPENLMAMVDFFYHGEANVYQENLDSFLNFAEELQLKGLRGNQTEKESEVCAGPTAENFQSKLLRSKAVSKQKSVTKDGSAENEPILVSSEKALALTDPTTNTTDIAGLDQQVKSMMAMSSNKANYGNRGKGRICKVCGKEGTMALIMDHIESNHIAEISLPCQLCGTISKSRSTLRNHKSRYHRNQ